MPLEPGREFSHYRIVGKLGEGGMGEVYRAVDLTLDRPVAIKLLPPGAAESPEAAERFLREARAASGLSHPNIITVYAVEQAEGRPFMAMELVEGETLRDRLGRGPIPLPQLIEMGLEVAGALDAAHAARLIHRDIKPSNVILTPRGSVKLLDFGLAKRFAPAGGVPSEATLSGEITTPGTIIGTVAYMSPEQSRGERLDPRTDVFSLGSLLYEAATGRAAFTGPSTIAVLHEIATRDPDPPSAVHPGLPYSFDLLIARALAKDRERRFASAAELADALRSIRAELTGTLPAASSEPKGAGPNNLPAEVTSFVGRAREVAEVKRLVAAHRLVTVTGPGGCGKTRLTLRVAADLLTEFRDGVWLTELAGLSDPALVPQAVAATLGLREEAERPIAETLAAYAAPRTLLLLLDNCEHLAAPCAALAAALLQAAPNVRLLATSREPLDVPGESRWPIPPLTAPGAETPAPATADRALQYEAVRLFVERARAAQASFALTERNAAAVSEICRELDGIPLAVELAAARANVLPVPEILARLRDRFRLLTGGSRTASARQQTLRATVDWSYELLSPEERTLFGRLSVFAGGFTLEAAEAVCSGDGIDELDVLDLLARLADRSLIAPDEGVAGAAHYRMLETLRQYGGEKLAGSGEVSAVQERHRAYFLSLAEGAADLLHGPEQALWLDRLAEAHDNFRAALGGALAGGDSACALRLGASLWRFWWLRGFWGEGQRNLAAVLAAADSSPESSSVRAVALRGAGTLARGRGQFRESEALLQESAALARKLGVRSELAAALRELGNVADDRGDWEAERLYYEESLALFRELGDRRGAQVTLHNLGNFWQGQGQLDRARGFYDEALSIARDLGDRLMEALALNGVGCVATDLGEHEAARLAHEQSLALQREAGQRPGAAYTLGELGILAILRGDLRRARELLNESVEVFMELGDTRDIAFALDRFARLAAAEKEPYRTLEFYGAGDAIRERFGAPRPPADQQAADHAIGVARSLLSPDAADAAYRAGRGMTLDAACRLALQPDEPTARSTGPALGDRTA